MEAITLGRNPKAELAQLEIDNISLCWPERPDDGMIFFRGSPDDVGLWRCGYIARRPTGLGCDNQVAHSHTARIRLPDPIPRTMRMAISRQVTVGEPLAVEIRWLC
jgi:hypothetical protein